ncbi:oligosaccharide flippase family protein [Enterobacter roggenkampii]|uniref:oligosaccharide flippase family protein n=1 Tax=Enterobacter roggenkampii TaxID=1812935 RepID=UPI00317B6C35
MSGFKRLLKNSLSNIINGFSNVILGIVISPVLLSNLSKVDFSIWSLTLQVGVLIGIFGIGLQVTVGRFVALHLSNPQQLQKVMHQSLLFALLLNMVCLSGIFFLAKFFFSFFPEVSETSANAKQILILIGSSFVINNIFAPFVGYFTGIERNDITAGVNIIFKVMLGTSILLLVHHGLDVIAWVYFAINSANQLAFYILYKTKNKSQRIELSLDKNLFRTIVVFFCGLLVWNIAQFLISGIGTFTVGKYSFHELAGFAVLMTLVNAGIGILGAMINPIIQPMIRMHNHGNNQHVEILVNKLIFLFSMIVFIGVFITWFASVHILGVWLGYQQATSLNIMFSLLLAAYLIRMIAAPYGLMLVAYGKQLSIAWLPVLEGLLNFTLSIFFVRMYGAIGIAYSTFISGVLIMAVYACKYQIEAEYKSKLIFVSFLIIPIMIAICLVSLVMTQSVAIHCAIYGMQMAFIAIFTVFIKKQIKSIKNLLNQY